MKINESQRLSSVNAYRAGAQAREKASARGKSQKDDVRISPQAKELLEAQRLGSAERTERLEALKSSVQGGTYSVRADLVAEKMLPYLK